MQSENQIIDKNDLILITGATGFIGPQVVRILLDKGFKNLRCLVRPSSDANRLRQAITPAQYSRIDMVEGNLLSPPDCRRVAKDVTLIYHLAAGRGEKSVPDAFANSVVTTRNLLQATLTQSCLRRFVSVSSFAVYSNRGKLRKRLLDESCPIEEHPQIRGDAYSFAKVRQDQIVMEFGKKHSVPFVLVRPGVVFGPGNEAITGRVGVDTFGIFVHLGGANPIPFTYVDNCAEAIVLAGLKAGVEGEVFNVVDDELPSSGRFLRLYKRHVRRFRSVYLPHGLSFLFCWAWEKYSDWSGGQLPRNFNRATWHAYWKRTSYSNQKVKVRLGWTPRVPLAEALQRHFQTCREKVLNA